MITIAIPFYNAERFLKYAIESVLHQTYSGWKLLLIDDGSTDNSLEIAKKYESNDSRITVYSDGENQNLAFRLNQIATLTKTKYLARMDADDIMHPERIEKQLGILEKNPGIDVLGTNAFSIDENNNIRGLRLLIRNNDFELISVNSFIHPTIMANTKWFIDNPYDTDAVRVEDAELWSRTAKDNVFKVYTEPLLFYRDFNDKYYRKYFNSVKPLLNISKKVQSNKWKFKALLQLLKGSVYYALYMMRATDMILSSRNFSVSNEVLFQNKPIIDALVNKIENV